jgi:hypothetical protein
MMSNQASLFKELEKANKNTKKVIYAAASTIERSVQEISDAGADHIREMITKPGKGKEYKYAYGQHRASAPGDPPAAEAGRPLHKSIISAITSGRRDGDRMQVEGMYGSTARYAPFLEYGWRRKGSVGEPRPFMRPTGEWVRGITPGIVIKNWIRARNAAIKNLPKNAGPDSTTYVGKIR